MAMSLTKEKQLDSRYPGLCSFRFARKVNLELYGYAIPIAAVPLAYEAAANNPTFLDGTCASLLGMGASCFSVLSMAKTEQYLSKKFREKSMGISRARPKMVAGQLVSHFLYIGAACAFSALLAQTNNLIDEKRNLNEELDAAVNMQMDIP